MAWYNWIVFFCFGILIFMNIKTFLQNRSIPKHIVFNSTFKKDGVDYHVVREDILKDLLLKETTLNGYIDSWLSNPKYRYTKPRPSWLVNDFAHLVYIALCSDECSEDPAQHWEGWVANRLGIIHEEFLSKAMKEKTHVG